MFHFFLRSINFYLSKKNLLVRVTCILFFHSILSKVIHFVTSLIDMLVFITYINNMWPHIFNQCERLPHLKIPFLTHHWTDLPHEALQIQEVVVVVAVQVPKEEGVEWGEPYEMELGYSFCSSSATPTIKRIGHKLYDPICSCICLDKNDANSITKGEE